MVRSVRVIKKPKRRDKDAQREKEHHGAIASGKSKMHKAVSGVRSRARR